MKISARNQFGGTVLTVTKGTTTAHVKVGIAPGQVVTASITNEAVEDLDLKVGQSVTVIIKSSDVLIATD